MYQIQDNRAESEIRSLSRSLRLPHTARQILGTSLSDLQTVTRSAVWALPKTKFADEVANFSGRHKQLGLKGPRPKLVRKLDVDYGDWQALKLSTSLHFAEIAVDADPFAEPILLYYSCAQLCGVMSRAFLRWEQDKPHHGLRFVNSSETLADTKVVIQDRGQFPRLANARFLLSGWPSCFSELVTYSSKPTEHIGPGELLANFGRNEIGIPISELTLDELANFDYGGKLKLVREHHGFHKFKGLSDTAFLIDVIALFLASSLARYEVIKWREVLEGKTNPYRVYFQETFERYRSFTINSALKMLQSPLRRFDERILPSIPSPYSHDDKIRFTVDPNHVV